MWLLNNTFSLLVFDGPKNPIKRETYVERVKVDDNAKGSGRSPQSSPFLKAKRLCKAKFFLLPKSFDQYWKYCDSTSKVYCSEAPSETKNSLSSSKNRIVSSIPVKRRTVTHSLLAGKWWLDESNGTSRIYRNSWYYLNQPSFNLTPFSDKIKISRERKFMHPTWLVSNTRVYSWGTFQLNLK